MSRFLSLLERRMAEGQPALDAASLRDVFDEMLVLLEAAASRIELSLPLFVRKTAPVSGVHSLMDCELTIVVEGGAHNQRSHVTVSIVADGAIEPEEITAIAEAQASSELYGLLKRVDEKHVTERAYDNPKFVEDLVRDVAMALRADRGIRRFTAEAENFESIHNHSTLAVIEGGEG